MCFFTPGRPCRSFACLSAASQLVPPPGFWETASPILLEDVVNSCFSKALLLKVTTAKGAFYFAPGTGKPATVMTRDGVPRCVLASNFKG